MWGAKEFRLDTYVGLKLFLLVMLSHQRKTPEVYGNAACHEATFSILLQKYRMNNGEKNHEKPCAACLSRVFGGLTVGGHLFCWTPWPLKSLDPQKICTSDRWPLSKGGQICGFLQTLEWRWCTCTCRAWGSGGEQFFTCFFLGGYLCDGSSSIIWILRDSQIGLGVSYS